MKKTYKEFSTEIDEVLSFGARKAVGRRMKMLSRRSSTKVRKAKKNSKSDQKLITETNDLMKDLREDMDTQNLNNYIKSSDFFLNQLTA